MSTFCLRSLGSQADDHLSRPEACTDRLPLAYHSATRWLFRSPRQGSISPLPFIFVSLPTLSHFLFSVVPPPFLFSAFPCFPSSVSFLLLSLPSHSVVLPMLSRWEAIDPPASFPILISFIQLSVFTATVSSTAINLLAELGNYDTETTNYCNDRYNARSI